MKRSKRMIPILGVAQRHQDEAARVVAERSNELGNEERRLQALQQYAHEYAGVPGVAGTIFNPALLANRQAFRERLAAAVQEQTGVVEFTRQACEHERQQLIAACRTKTVMEKLTAGYRAAEQLIAGKRNQSVLDDLGARCIPRLKQERTA